MSKRVLHILSQRPSRTGSGVTLEHLVNQAAEHGWEQEAVVGVPSEDATPPVGVLDQEAIYPLVFGQAPLDFALPGMSDVMPYTSTVFSSLGSAQVETYLDAWRAHIRPIVQRFRPHVIHSHHIWLMSSVLKDVAPGVPIVTHCHATGLRQLELCPHLASRVKAGVRRNEHFVVLHQGHADALVEALDISAERVTLVGAGYGEETFGSEGRESAPGHALLYAGKYSEAKGLPQLLDALELLVEEVPDLVLHVAGSGAGDEAERLRRRMQAMAQVRLHGQVPQAKLAQLMRQSALFILPSFYEGLPLVCVEAAACGAKVVATDLPGVRLLSEALGPWLYPLKMPRLQGVDTPRKEDLPAFVSELRATLLRALQDAPPSRFPELSLWTWGAVFERVQRTWNAHLG